MKWFLLVLVLLVAVFGLSSGNAVACDGQTLGVCNGVIGGGYGGGANYLVQPQVAFATQAYAQPVFAQQVYASPVVQNVVGYNQFAVRQNVVVGHNHFRQNVVVGHNRANVVVRPQRGVVVRGGVGRANVVVGY